MKLFCGELWSRHYRTSLWDELSKKESGTSCQELGSVYLGEGERNVTTLGLGCGMAKVNWLQQRKILRAWEQEEKEDD